MKEYKIVGKSIRRLDAWEKSTGTGTFTTDIYLPGMLFGKVLRSPYPHARIKKIDTAKAEQLPGVEAVVCYKNSTRVKFNTSATMTTTVPPMKPVLDQYIFDNVVRYVGDEVAAVAAVDERIALQALELIEVEYEQLPAVYDAKQAMTPDALEIHSDCPAGKNIPGEMIHMEMGDLEQGFNESDLIFEEEFKLPIVKQVQMETQAAVAQASIDGSITVYSTTQTPHPSAQILAHIFQLPVSKVRVLNPPYLGGGFGVRIGLSAKAEAIATELAMKTGKPVKVVYDRKEDFTASDTRHGGYVTVKLGVKNDGVFHALELKSNLNTGAYCSFGVETVGVLGAMGLSVYRIPHQVYNGHSTYTNCTPAGAMRGFGNPQAMFAIESVVDMAAERLGLDAKELRLKNIIKPGDKWVLPYPCKSSGLPECIEKGAREIGWNNRGKLNKPGDKIRRGIGMGVGTHVSNSWPFCVDFSNALVTVKSDGTIKVASGVVDMGTGTHTSLAQIAAETVGMYDMSKVSVAFADTESTPFEIGSHASRSCYTAGQAVYLAAQDARTQVLEYAADYLKERIEYLDIKDGIIYSNDEARMPLAELTEYAHLHNKQFLGVGKVVPSNAPPWEAHFAEVEVDTETGQVRVIKLVAAHDVGKAIHPAIVEGQLEGGLVQGMGYALSEEIRYNDKGKQLHDGIHKYMLPTAEDIPEIKVILVEPYDPSGPYGAKGVGETSLVPTAPAITNAIYDAIGIRFKEIPVTEEKIFKALYK
ncbi:molybdopterin cofactor-binding domain-containing protein [Desulfoscipio sp. XC116]|uniref:xanthine dehydrogenase family protein molybdopterin-binding subunit n=1 Tax=Desulfoscipio sp. XC116 TaxID=3144975 RepID=UPI00325AD4FD